MGVKNLRKLQIGVESTKGTSVAATAILRMTGTLEDARTLVNPDEQVGLLMPTDRQYTSSYLGKLAMDGVVTFEQFPYILNASIHTDTGVAQDGAGSDYIRTYTFPTTAKNDIFTYTIEGGDDAGVEEMDYSYVSDFTLSGKYGEAWQISSNWQGQNIVPSTFTALGSTTIATVSEALFGLSKFYVDDSTGTIGTTQVASTLFEATLNFKTGWVPKYTADGALDFTFLEQVGPEITLDVTYEHNATAVAEKAKWRAGTARLIKLLIEGPTVVSAGTTYSKKSIIALLPGRWESFDAIGDIDGNDIIHGVFRVGYDVDYGSAGSIIVVNEVATMP